MPTRNVYMRIMLWSLGLAAAGGVLAVLSVNRYLAWRVVWTGFTTAVACGIMIPVGGLVDRKETRSAGLFGMGAVVVEFLLAMLLIWEVPRHVFLLNIENEIAGTMGLGVGICVLVPCFLILARKPYGAWAGRAGVVFTIAAFAAWLVAVWLPYNQNRGQIRDNWGETGAALSVLGAFAVLCLVGGGWTDPRRWRYAGVIAGVVACCMWLIDIWIGTGSDPGYVIFCGLLILATVVAHANVSVRATIAPEHAWVRTCTLVAAVCTALMIELFVIDDRLYPMLGYSGLIERLAAAGGIVTACGTLALVVFARFDRRIDYESVTADLSRISVVCPRCNKKQMIGVGDSVCASCKLRISIRLEEPRCPKCDYLLFGLTSGRCPECGTQFVESAASAPSPEPTN
ncbi:MAG: hypothetical protein IH989_04890 [Planctomycetes bacterium]|nr:hypothetical protein [Planctomycetota bacterium]